MSKTSHFIMFFVKQLCMNKGTSLLLLTVVSTVIIKNFGNQIPNLAIKEQKVLVTHGGSMAQV